MASPTPFIPLAPDTFSGRKLGKYEIVCRLSTGGMSEIFLAFQRGVGGFRKYVVLKQILPDIKGEEEFVRMFLDEAKITAAFNHPNIAHVYDLDIADGELFLAMEFVPGATLVEVARMCRINSEPIPIGMTLQAVRDTALALHYAHTFTDQLGQPQPVIHRDIAEKNVMVTYEGGTKLLDFGIAKAQGNAGRTQIGMVKGTSGYMSPEQILGEQLDGRSDIFSLGVVLHECLTGMRLFHAKTAEQGMMAPLRETVSAPSKQNPAITPEIDEVVLKALRRSRDERHGTALELARELEAAAGKLIWNPEQTAPFVQRIFADRREQTRQLLSNVENQPQGELTGEIRLNAYLRGDAPPLARAAPPPRPVQEPAEPPRERTGRKMTSPGVAVPARAKPSRTHTDEDTNPRTPAQRPAKGRHDNEYTQPLISRPPVPDEVTNGSGVRDEPRTKLNRPEDLVRLMDAPVKVRTGTRPSAPPVPDEHEERTIDARPSASRPPTWDRDDDDSDAEVRTIVARKTPPRASATGEHDTVSAVAPSGSGARTYLLIGLMCGGAALGAMFVFRTMMPGASTPAESPTAQLPPEPTPIPKPVPPPEVKQELAIVPVEAPAVDAGLVADQVIAAVPEAPTVAAVEPLAKKVEAPAPVVVPVVKRAPPKPKVVTKKPPVERAKANAEAKGEGQLTLVTTPWAKVHYKSQDLGVTPLFKVSLPAGKHTLKLVGPDNQIVMLPVEIRAGEVTTLRQKLADVSP